MPLLFMQNKGHRWSLQVVYNCHRFVENFKYMFKGSPICVACICQIFNFIHPHGVNFKFLFTHRLLFSCLIWTMCRWSRTWLRIYQFLRISLNMLKGVDRLVEHTKAQQLCFYMRDDGVPAMQFKLLCTSPNWDPEDGIGVWRQDKNEKSMLPDGDPKPCKPDPIRNGPKIIKGISIFIEYWTELCEEDITRRIWNTYEHLIAYWDRIRSPLITLGVDTHTTLTQIFWPQSRLTVVESNAMFFNNKDVCEEFVTDEHYVGLVHNCPAPSLRVGVNCHEGYMVLVCGGDDEHPKPI